MFQAWNISLSPTCSLRARTQPIVTATRPALALAAFHEAQVLSWADMQGHTRKAPEDKDYDHTPEDLPK